MALNAGIQDAVLAFKISQADLIANLDEEIVSPVDGYIARLDVAVNKANTSAGTLNVRTGPASATVVAGMQVSVAAAAAKGTRYASTPTAKSTTRAVAKGDRIVIRPAAFATGGEVSGYLTIKAADTDGVMPF